MLVGCGDDNCAKWIHEECLKHYALMRVYERLGTDKPHIAVKPSPGDVVKSETAGDDVKEPLSPRESGGAASAQHSIDVKADTVEVQGASDDDESSSGGARANGDGGKEAKDVAVRSKAKDDAAAAGASGTPPLKREVTPSESDAGGLQQAKKGGLATPTPAAASSSASASASASKARKSPAGAGVAVASSSGSSGKKAAAGRAFPTLQSFGNKKKPYDKLFEASLLLTPLDSTAPTMIEIRDLRRKVEGGEKEWLEPAECPVCGSAIR